MTTALVQKLTGVRDLKKILETTVKELGESFGAESCQIMLSNPLDPNVTAICEYRASKEECGQLPSLMLPLNLQGKAFGHLSIARQQSVSPDEINSIRITLAELGDIIRHAQINDIVQRDTFRDTFLVEIGNVMAYSLGIGDALFMVVNILGKVLHASRCLFVCTDDQQAGWRCYEYWQQGQFQSCRDFCWPTSDSPLVAQTLLAEAPLMVFEGQQNSYVTPVQEEMQFIGAKSVLGVALRSEAGTHGCVILQQCDYRRAWTRGEIDMVQNVADKVAEALAKLPAEKKQREPIMQLHQRIVTAPEGQEGKQTIQSVRNALKGALGQQAIPVAQKTSAPPPPPKPAAPPPAPPPPPPAAQPAALESFAPGADVWGGGAQEAAAAPQDKWAPPQQVGGKSLSSILGGIQKSATGQAMAAVDFGPPSAPDLPPAPAAQVPPPAEAGQAAAAWGAPAAESPWGEPAAEAGPASAWGEPQTAGSPQQAAASQWGNLDAIPAPGTGAAAQAASQWGNLDAIPAPGTGAAAEAASQWGNLDAIPTPGTGAAAQAASQWGNLDAIPTPGTGAAAQAPSQWGNLDAIPTPSTGPATTGLAGSMMSKVKVHTGPGSALMSSFTKDKTKYQPEPTRIEGPPIEIDEAAAQAKLKQILSSSNPTSDYIFATPGVDARMLGRIDGWVSQIEAKEKYANGHARQVAEYSVAIARCAGLPQPEVDVIRLAALVHDVGKLGAAPQILQKPEEELSDAELLLVMKHPLDGAELLESFPDLKHLAPIVRCHHEEFDGNGFPAGLKGEEIPVGARILAVADSYHKMTSAMRTRPGMSPTEAQQQLQQGAGKLWDPRFVEALLLAIAQGQVPAAFS